MERWVVSNPIDVQRSACLTSPPRLGRGLSEVSKHGLTRPHLPRAIEPRVKNTDQKFLAMTRGFFRRAHVELDARHSMQQPDDPARQPLRVGNAVARQSLAQIAG